MFYQMEKFFKFCVYVIVSTMYEIANKIKFDWDCFWNIMQRNFDTAFAARRVLSMHQDHLDRMIKEMTNAVSVIQNKDGYGTVATAYTKMNYLVEAFCWKVLDDGQVQVTFYDWKTTILGSFMLEVEDPKNTTEIQKSIRRKTNKYARSKGFTTFHYTFVTEN